MIKVFLFQYFIIRFQCSQKLSPSSMRNACDICTVNLQSLRNYLDSLFGVSQSICVPYAREQDRHAD